MLAERARETSKTKVGCTAFWSIEAIVGVVTGTSAFPLITISPCVIVKRRSASEKKLKRIQLKLWCRQTDGHKMKGFLEQNGPENKCLLSVNAPFYDGD